MDMKNKRIFYLSLLVMAIGFASSASAVTYRLQRVTSVESGQKYVFEQAGYVLIGSITKNALESTNDYKTFGLDGTESYVWERMSGDRLKSVKGSGYYLTYSSELKFASSSNSNSNSYKWNFLFQNDGTTYISSVGKSGDSLGETSFTSNAYKLYTGSLGQYPHSFVVYELVPDKNDGKKSAELNFLEKFYRFMKGESFVEPSLSCADGFDGVVTYSSSNTNVAQVDPTTGKVTIVGTGRALITASSSATLSYDAGEATYTLLVMGGNGSVGSPYSVSDFYSGYLASGSKYVQGYIVGGYKADGTKTTGLFEEYPTTDDYIALADSKDGADASNTIPIDYESFGLNSHFELKGCKVLLQGTILQAVLTKTSITNVSSASILSYAATISSYKYATYRTSEKLNFTDTGVSAYTAAINGDHVVLTKIEDGIVDTGLGVVLYSETAGSFDIPVTTADATVTSTGLSISDGSTATKENMTYVLGKKNDVGFYRWVGAESLPAGRVYLNGSVSTARDYLEFTFDEETTGMSDASHLNKGEIRTNVVYDLQGRRVAQPAKGLYIVNGKKVVIK